MTNPNTVDGVTYLNNTVADMMRKLSQTGQYRFTDDELRRIRAFIVSFDPGRPTITIFTGENGND